MNWNQSSTNKINDQSQTQQGRSAQDYKELIQDQNLTNELLGALKQGYEDRYKSSIIL